MTSITLAPPIGAIIWSPINPAPYIPPPPLSPVPSMRHTLPPMPPRTRRLSLKSAKKHLPSTPVLELFWSPPNQTPDIPLPPPSHVRSKQAFSTVHPRLSLFQYDRVQGSFKRSTFPTGVHDIRTDCDTLQTVQGKHSFTFLFRTKKDNQSCCIPMYHTYNETSRREGGSQSDPLARAEGRSSTSEQNGR